MAGANVDSLRSFQNTKQMLQTLQDNKIVNGMHTPSTWLNAAALEEHINFSQVRRNALIHQFSIRLPRA